MKIALKKLYGYLDIPSGAAIGFLSLNLVGMLWHDVLKTGLTMADVSMVAAVFAAKTTHGIMTAKKDGTNDEN